MTPGRSMGGASISTGQNLLGSHFGIGQKTTKLNLCCPPPTELAQAYLLLLEHAVK
jgi:hypothetical protein